MSEISELKSERRDFLRPSGTDDPLKEENNEIKFSSVWFCSTEEMLHNSTDLFQPRLGAAVIQS